MTLLGGPVKLDPHRCKAITVSTRVQCELEWTEDGWCKMHHPTHIKRRRAERTKKHNDRWRAREIQREKGARCALLRQHIVLRVEYLMESPASYDEALSDMVKELRALEK